MIFTFIRFDNYENNLQIQTQHIIYNNSENWYNLSQQKLLNLIQDIYAERNLTFKYNYEKTIYEEKEDGIAEEFFFKELCLTLWFNSFYNDNNKLSVHKLSTVCIEKLTV